MAIAIALVFVWLGMVLAISFVEAPLKFRAPGVTVQIGLGIGRLVFRALNACEVVLGTGALVAVFRAGAPVSARIALVVAGLTLAIQLVLVRPALSRRSSRVLASTGSGGPRSRAHYAYVAFEVVKVVALVAAGALLLASHSPI